MNTVKNTQYTSFMKVNENGRIVINATKEELVSLIEASSFDVKCNAILALEILTLRQIVYEQQDGTLCDRLISAEHLADYIWEDDLEHASYEEWISEGNNPEDHVLYHAGIYKGCRYLKSSASEFETDIENFKLLCAEEDDDTKN